MMMTFPFFCLFVSLELIVALVFMTHVTDSSPKELLNSCQFDLTHQIISQLLSFFSWRHLRGSLVPSRQSGLAAPSPTAYYCPGTPLNIILGISSHSLARILSFRSYFKTDYLLPLSLSLSVYERERER